MTDYETLDMFSDPSINHDPYPYFEFLRSKGPATPLPYHNAVAVTGYEEGLSVISDNDFFSAAVSVNGPIPPLPFEPEGDDITEQLEAHRATMPYSGIIITEDMPDHAKTKSLLLGMISPKRLAENEEFMHRYAQELIDAFIDKGTFEAVWDFGQPFATVVIADLLGVPEEDRAQYKILRSGIPGQYGEVGPPPTDPLMEVGMHFYGYIQDRRDNPRDDVLGRLAQVKYKDGSTPEVIDVVKTATFLFGAGQHTTVLLLASALRLLAEDQALQQKLRDNRDLIPTFVEEALRLQSPAKVEYRLVKKTTKVGDLEVKAGTIIVLFLAAMNRDPRRFERPSEIMLDRENIRDHLAFGRGIHSCAGSPLARAEARIALNHIFDRLGDIRINESKHGPEGDRTFEYEPTYTLRGLKELHLDFTKLA